MPDFPDIDFQTGMEALVEDMLACHSYLFAPVSTLYAKLS